MNEISPLREALQKTIARRVSFDGIGLHSGIEVSAALCPAPVDHGLLFWRKDLDLRVPVSWRQAVESPLCTLLVGPNGEQIGTVEHLVSALSALNIDNALIELDGPEVPALDGSADRFVALIDRAGIETQNAPRRAIQILKRIEVSEPGRSVRLDPAEQFEMSFEIDFPDSAIGRQVWEGTITADLYRKKIARARTFGMLAEVEAMRNRGLGLGGSLDNAVVVHQGTVMNPGGLRYADEFVRHKVLDAIGDLALAGSPIVGRFTGYKAGHALTLRLVTSLFARPEAWRWVALESDWLGGSSPLVSVRAAAQWI
ncbi:MAG: UDP-3-O-[3-hydroxymyristoyl] N-acetylglucosamine deacetylase [Rhodospirillales bacterium]|nr:UDP-3-O-[3-hydroxymyristoyl] N-acetylglucosamine deacetylase [Rhodospirillales bacterium]